jgi:hypothetical protein
LSATSKVLDRLEGVKQTGAGRWMARCPAHEDRSPSLSVRETENGRTLLHCFGSCPNGDVLSAMGLRMSDLFEKPLGHHFPPVRGGFNARELFGTQRARGARRRDARDEGGRRWPDPRGGAPVAPGGQRTPLRDIPDFIIAHLQDQTERLNQASAILGVTLRSLEKTAPDLEDEVQSLMVAMSLVGDISHRIDPVVLTNPPGAAAVTSARQARKEAAHG